MRLVTDKLLIRPGKSVWMVGCPPSLRSLLPLPEEQVEPFPDVVVAFATSIADIQARAPEVIARYKTGAALWIVYPKKGGAIKTDLTRDHGWDVMFTKGFLVVSIAAIDTTWSAVRFRLREEIKSLTRKSENC
jgi:hypothetical protein